MNLTFPNYLYLDFGCVGLMGMLSQSDCKNPLSNILFVGYDIKISTFEFHDLGLRQSVRRFLNRYSPVQLVNELRRNTPTVSAQCLTVQMTAEDVHRRLNLECIYRLFVGP